MAILKVEGTKEFFYVYMKYHAVQHGFNAREIAVAAEFLYFRDRYLRSPLTRQVLEVEEDGAEVMKQQEMSMLEQLKDKRTLHLITTNLDMSFTVFRKHVKALQEKKFFHLGGINSKFIPADNHVATFKLQTK